LGSRLLCCMLGCPAYVVGATSPGVGDVVHDKIIELKLTLLNSLLKTLPRYTPFI
jgi:hypothetical protein